MDERRLPLFPLNVVLFPGMLLPLHVFEPRYRELVRDCLRAEAPFGVCLIQHGPEVGGPATPHAVGTTCEILKVSRYEDGRMDLITVGRERFVVRELILERSYLEGNVVLHPEASAECPQTLVAEVRRAAFDYARRVMPGMPEEAASVSLPEEPRVLSHLVASLLMQVSVSIRQELLEMDDVEARLRRELTLLQTLTDPSQLEPEAQAARPFRMKPGSFNPN